MITNINQFKLIKENRSNYVDSNGYGYDDDGNDFYVTDKRYWGKYDQDIPSHVIRDIEPKQSYETKYTIKQIATQLSKSTKEIKDILKALNYINDSGALTTAGLNSPSKGKTMSGKFGSFPVFNSNIKNEINKYLVDNPVVAPVTNDIIKPMVDKIDPDTYTGLLSTKQLSEQTGLSSINVNKKLVELGLMQKIDGKWSITELGLENNGKVMTGDYGDYILWPAKIINMLK